MQITLFDHRQDWTRDEEHVEHTFADGFPSIADAGGLTIGNCNRMNSVGVVVIKNNYMMIAATRRNRKFTSLIGVRFHDMIFFKKHGKYMTTGRSKQWFEVWIRRCKWSIRRRNLVERKCLAS